VLNTQANYQSTVETSQALAKKTSGTGGPDTISSIHRYNHHNFRYGILHEYLAGIL
jgi:hypothetical protein